MIFTIGHSTRTFEEFLALLEEHRIERVVDIRSFPGSRKFPHFGRDRLEDLLAHQPIGYQWYKDLGGFRKRAAGESLNAGLTSAGFRNYADYMESPAFRAAAAELIDRSERERITVMCAERLFWSCHRRILSDYLVSRGVEVVHILEPGKIMVHTLSEGAVPTAETVIYPPRESL